MSSGQGNDLSDVLWMLRSPGALLLSIGLFRSLSELSKVRLCLGGAVQVLLGRVVRALEKSFSSPSSSSLFEITTLTSQRLMILTNASNKTKVCSLRGDHSRAISMSTVLEDGS